MGLNVVWGITGFLNRKHFFFAVFLSIFFFLCTNYSTTLVHGASQNEDYRGPAYCLDCHVEEMEDWLTSKHSTSYDNSDFLNTWADVGSPDDCLSCHTTGYSSDTGMYVIDSVSCEECHGPGNTMYVNNTVALCAECHTGPYPTYEEWKSSGPAHGNATCYTCHDQHTAGLVFDTPTETCGQCHEFEVAAVDKTLHGQSGVQCSDCHMAFVPANFTTGKPGYTGHSFNVTAAHLDCTTCHDRPLVKHDVLGSRAFACLSCHGEIHKLELKLVNGTVYPLTESAELCGQCHIQRYNWWKDGIHVETHVANSTATCVDCHEPHDPLISGITALSFLPPREPGPGQSILNETLIVVGFEILLFAAFLWRWRNNDQGW